MDADRRKLLGEGIAQLNARLDVCLWPGSDCSAKAIRAHSIQNSRILERLARNGKVIAFRFRPNESGPVTLTEVGRHQATTFTGLCAKHDSDLFRSIEVSKLELSSPQHLFLLAYRALLRQVHATRKSAIDLQANYQRGAEAGLWPRDRPSPAGLLACDRFRSALELEVEKAELDAAYISTEWSRLAHRTIRLSVPPSIAASAYISTGFHSAHTDQPAYVALTVLPVDDGTVGIFSFLSEHEPLIRKAFSSVWNGPSRHVLFELSRLVLLECENLAIAPDVYERFSTRQKELIAHYAADLSPWEPDPDAPSVSLFCNHPAHRTPGSVDRRV